MNNLQEICPVQFPEYTGIDINMMPIIFGDSSSIPEELHGYIPILEECNLQWFTTAYLTITETIVEAGNSQRRPGIHTDRVRAGDWGGGWGGGYFENLPLEGIYIASTDGLTEIWDKQVTDVGLMGECNCLDPGITTKANTLYWMTDKTPHRNLPSPVSGRRQFVRLVADKVSFWFSKHSTPNPLGIKPNATVINADKFSASIFRGY